MSQLRVRVLLVVAAVSFVVYPALRPYGPEAGAAGAADALDFADHAWLVAHAFGMVGFVALALALREAALTTPWRWSGRPVREAESRMWVAVVLLLPYYGAEAYGLHEIGRYAVATGDPGVLDVADRFRYAPLEIVTFALGLLVLVLVGGRLALGLWGSGAAGRAGGLLTGLGLATYLPQFLAPGAVRIGHGIVLGVGLLLVAYAVQVRSQMVCGDDSSLASASDDRASTSVTT